MEAAKLMAYANTDGVNVRTEPNTDSTIWTQISNKESFLVASQQDGCIEGFDGYNGDLTSAQAGSIGGEMVRKMIMKQEQQMSGK